MDKIQGKSRIMVLVFTDFLIFSKSSQLWEARSRRLLNRFQKINIFLLATLRDTSIALCFGSIFVDSRVDSSPRKLEFSDFDIHRPTFGASKKRSPPWLRFLSTKIFFNFKNVVYLFFYPHQIKEHSQDFS